MLRTLLPFLAAITLSISVGHAEETAPAAPARPGRRSPSRSGCGSASRRAAAGHRFGRGQGRCRRGVVWHLQGTDRQRSRQADRLESAATPINNGDNAWMLTSCLLVLMMTIPGLALFYGGLVRRKNVLSTMMHSFSLAGIVTVIWTVFGFAIASAAVEPAARPSGADSTSSSC